MKGVKDEPVMSPLPVSISVLAMKILDDILSRFPGQIPYAQLTFGLVYHLGHELYMRET